MKYELTNQCIDHPCTPNIKLYRIKALRDIGKDVKAGDLGGYIEKEENLAQHDECWVYDEAMVFGNARVAQFAQVRDQAQVYNNAMLLGYATAMDIALVSRNAKMFDCTTIAGSAVLTDIATMRDAALLAGTAVLEGRARLSGDAEMRSGSLGDGCMAGGTTYINIDTAIRGRCYMWGDAHITGRYAPITIDIIEPLTITREADGSVKINTYDCDVMTYKQFKEYATRFGYTAKQIKAVKQLYKAAKEMWNES